MLKLALKGRYFFLELDPGATSATMGTAVVALWGWLSSRIQGWQSEKKYLPFKAETYVTAITLANTASRDRTVDTAKLEEEKEIKGYFTSKPVRIKRVKKIEKE